MPGSRKARPSWPFPYLLFLAAAVFAAGCSTANNSGGGTSASHVLPSGGSVPGWIIPTGGSLHASEATNEYVSKGMLDSCTECHGANLSGGISDVSCFGNPAGCHHGTIAGWATPQEHGVWAKRAPGDGSFFSCQICHGKIFSGGGAQTACSTCHTVNAPHPPKPWLSATGLTHTTTDPANAPVCAQCHFPGSQNNPANHPATPAAAGTPPGCFNSTLCHAAAAPHPVGNAWVTTPPAAQPHATDAKATPSATTGFAFCQICHGTGTDFAGGSSEISCYTCHGVNAPHPTQWRTGDVYVHTSTAEGNATVCAFCHLNGANSPIDPPKPPAPAGTVPGCFNSTLCHGPPFHPTDWAQATQHGPVAKQAPSASGGFAFCQICHGSGTSFAGGPITEVSCYPCHGVSAPHPAQWLPGDTFVHTSTAEGNAPVCAFCHLNGANSPDAPPSPPAPEGTAPGCFNSTLCH